MTDRRSHQGNTQLKRRALIGFALAAVLTQPLCAAPLAHGHYHHKQPKISTTLNMTPNGDSLDTTHVEGIIRDSCNCRTLCTDTARDVVAAANLWLEVMKRRGVAVPDYINAAYAIRCAGIESVLDPLSQRRGSEYSGLMQYSRTDHKKTFWSVAPELVPYFNADDVRAHVQLTAKPTKIVLDSFENEKIFLNPQVQVAALMFSALRLSQQIEDTPALRGLPPEYKQAWLYLYHNLPDMAWIVRKDIGSPIPISGLAPRSFVHYYRKNSGIYGKNGSATPLEVLARIDKITGLFFNRFHPDGNQFMGPSVAQVRPVVASRPKVHAVA
ncbi:MAG: hypothetical protein WCD70_06965 [Alphaproteobacteria bacterium]